MKHFLSFNIPVSTDLSYINVVQSELLPDTHGNLVTFRNNVSDMWDLPPSQAAALFGCQYRSALVFRRYPAAVLSLSTPSVYNDNDQQKSL